jgi:hypothetical protein
MNVRYGSVSLPVCVSERKLARQALLPPGGLRICLSRTSFHRAERRFRSPLAWRAHVDGEAGDETVAHREDVTHRRHSFVHPQLDLDGDPLAVDDERSGARK